jgi:uncharacterized protein (DUF983 family)
MNKESNKSANLDSRGSSVSQWSGFIHSKCPRCHTGSVFTGSVYGLKQQSMNEVCEACDLKFEREPGYFYVAMFVSYAMNVAEMISLSVAAYVLGLDIVYENLWYFVLVIFAAVVLLAPFNYRYSRMVLLYWLSPGLHYDPSRLKKGALPNRVSATHIDA